MGKFYYATDGFEKYSLECEAVHIVREHVNSATNDFWVCVHEANIDYLNKEGDKCTHIICELFYKQLIPQYPAKKNHSDSGFRSVCRHITWAVSHEDINNQLKRGVKGPVFKIFGKRISSEKEGNSEVNQDNAAITLENFAKEKYYIMDIAKISETRLSLLKELFNDFKKGKLKFPKYHEREFYSEDSYGEMEICSVR